MHEDRVLGDRGQLGRFGPRPDGLLTCIGRGAVWFERHTDVRSPIGRPLPLASWEDPVLEEIDACLHIASDDEDRLARVTEAPFGPGPLDQRPRLSLRETRTGFVGPGLAAERLAASSVPADSPLLLGFPTHFVSLQRDLEDFNATRATMNAADARTHHAGIGARHAKRHQRVRRRPQSRHVRRPSARPARLSVHDSSAASSAGSVTGLWHVKCSHT
jgi:hypothetical protein